MNDNDRRMCPDCRGKGQYAGLDITCRRCNGTCCGDDLPQ